MVLRRSSSLKRTPIKKVGRRAKEWEKCRSEMVSVSLNEDGLIHCQDVKAGLPPCGVAKLPKQMDLHHLKSRDGKLLTDKRYLVFLTRECHERAHDASSR